MSPPYTCGDQAIIQLRKLYPSTYDAHAMKIWRLPVLLTAAATFTAFGQNELTLYPHPDWSVKPIASVSPDDPRFMERGAVVDPVKAALGWRWGEFDGEFIGYVPDAKIGKDLYPVAGALIHAHPDIDSHVLGTVTAEDLESDNIEVVDRGPWWTIRFSKPIPVFFSETVVRGAPDQETVEEADPPQEVPEETMAEPEDQPEQSPLPELADGDSRQKAGQPSAGSAAGSIASTFRGTLQRTKTRFLLFSPPYPYELLDRNHQRLAYIDFSDAVLRRPISHYVGQNISVYGPWEAMDASGIIVIRARNLNELTSR